MSRRSFVYILSNRKHGTLYVGVTSDLARRIAQHKSDVTGGFTTRYGTKSLVWFEVHDDVEMAIVREKRIKRWRRSWKIALVEEANPEWRDLFDDIL